MGAWSAPTGPGAPPGPRLVGGSVCALLCLASWSACLLEVAPALCYMQVSVSSRGGLIGMGQTDRTEGPHFCPPISGFLYLLANVMHV